jgi:integrase
MRKSLSDKGVASLRLRSERYTFPDPELRGHYVRVQPSGSKSFVVVARNPSGKQVWTNIGAADVLSIEAARKLARKAIERVRSGLPAVEAGADSFAAVSANWIKRHVEPSHLRTEPEIRRQLERYILPAWRARAFTSIRRSDVAALLDHVEDEHGPRQADSCLDVVRSIMNWYSARNDDYNPVIARGMRRQTTKAQARTRVLDDAEIRAVWRAAESAGTFGAIIRFALLTAQRRQKIVTMKWSDLAGNVWTIPTAPREKGHIGSVALPPLAMSIVNAQPHLGNNPYVFAGRGNGYFDNLSKPKLRLDAQLKGIAPWIIHDLRRSSRSLLSRAGVPSEHAEKVMGHVVAGVEGTYNRHRYTDEKSVALGKLAMLVAGIINPRDNVLPMAKQKKHR